MMHAIALDDEPPSLKIIEHFCSKTEGVLLQKTFTQPNKAQKYLRRFPTDLLFLDIQMPSLSGLDFYKSLDQEIMVIFTTAHREYAVEGFELSAVDYLLKPFTFERFRQAVTKAGDYYAYTRQLQKPGEPQSLFLRADYSLIKVNIADILYLEGLDDYLKIHLQASKPLVVRMTMKAILEKLPAGDFMRIHRSFIIPISGIDSIRNKIVTIAGREIPIGSSYEKEFFARFGQ
ncbi:MAG: response regulator transcription factor [Saprospiraceae bacterium]|nr:response regulator transcription factor [Saprospiraceae bacterium]